MRPMVRTNIEVKKEYVVAVTELDVKLKNGVPTLEEARNLPSLGIYINIEISRGSWQTWDSLNVCS